MSIRPPTKRIATSTPATASAGIHQERDADAVDQRGCRHHQRGVQAEADRAAGDLEHVDDRAREARARRIERRDRDRRDRGVEQADADAEHHHARHQLGIGRGRLHPGQQEHAQRQADGAERDDQLGAEPGIERPGRERGQREGAHHRQEAGAGTHRREAELLGHQLRQEEQGREEDRRHQQRRHARGEERRVAEHVAPAPARARPPGARPWRTAGGSLRPATNRPRIERAGPAEVDPQVERQQQGQQADREREHAGIVDPLVVRVDGDARHDPPDDRDREGRDRQVEEEDPAPAQRIGEGAAEQAGRRRCRSRPSRARGRRRAPPGPRASARRSCPGSPATSRRRRRPWRRAPRAASRHRSQSRRAPRTPRRCSSRRRRCAAGRTCRRAVRRSRSARRTPGRSR